MECFLDSADLTEITQALDYPIISGITTNPSLVATQSKGSVKELVNKLCSLRFEHLSVELLTLEFEEMVQQGLELAALSNKLVIKLPITKAGVRACHYLTSQGCRVNMTLCFSLAQALVCAKAGASYISPFIGRLEDNGQEGLQLLKEIVQVFRDYNLPTKVLAASIRHRYHFQQAALLGADIATMSFKTVQLLIDHPLTTQGLDQFNLDWLKAQMKWQ